MNSLKDCISIMIATEKTPTSQMFATDGEQAKQYRVW